MVSSDRAPHPPLSRYGQGHLEDLEEGLRQVILLLAPDGRHPVSDRDEAVLLIAREHLGVD